MAPRPAASGAPSKGASSADRLPYPQCPPLGRGYGRWFLHAEFWRPYAEAVAARHGLPAPGALSAPEPGSHPVFRAAAGYFLKFYAPHWPLDAAAEADAYAALGAGPALPVPALLAHGRLFAGGGRWPWPYLVTGALPGCSVGQLRAELQPADLRQACRDLALVVRALHRLPVPSAPSRGWRRRVADLQRSAPERRRRDGWPEPLVLALPDYLDAALGSAGDIPRRLCHGDLTADHALLLPDGAAGWRLAGLLDFADAALAEAAYDLVALFSSLCAWDGEALLAFLEAYGPDPAWRPGCRRRATAYLLLFPADVLPRRLRTRTPEEIEAELWPPGLP